MEFIDFRGDFSEVKVILWDFGGLDFEKGL